MEGMGFFMFGMIIVFVLIVIALVSLLTGLLLGFLGVPLIYKLRGIPKDQRRIGWGLRIVLSLFLAVITGLIVSAGTFLFLFFGG